MFHGYWGCAAGKAKQAAVTEIEKLSMKSMTCDELVKQAAKIIYTVHDEVKERLGFILLLKKGAFEQNFPHW